MIRTVRVATILITSATIAAIASTATAQTTAAKWIDVGVASNGERLRLNANSIKFEKMAVDDSINMEGMDNEDIARAKFPMHRVVSFKYTVGGRERMAYTTSCRGSNLKANPYWRTFTTYIDFWPQYFSVAADTTASRNMLARVCKLSALK